MRPAIGSTSTTRASAVFHTAPNTAEPSAVIRLTVWAGTSDGGINGGGGGAAGVAAGACAAAIDDIITGTAASAAHTARLRRIFLRIVFLPIFRMQSVEFKPTVDCDTRGGEEQMGALRSIGTRPDAYFDRAMSPLQGGRDKPAMTMLRRQCVGRFGVHPFGPGSLLGKKDRLIVLCAMEYVQNLDGVGDDPIEDQIVSIRPSAHAATLVSGNERKGL